MERYVFENRIFKDAFTHGFKVGNLYQVAGWSIGDHVSWHISSITPEVYCGALPDVSQIVSGMPEFKKSMTVHVWDVPKENITRGPFPSCSRSTGLEHPEEVWDSWSGISHVQGEESPLWLEANHLGFDMKGLIAVRWSWDSLRVKAIQTIVWRFWMIDLSYRRLLRTTYFWQV